MKRAHAGMGPSMHFSMASGLARIGICVVLALFVLSCQTVGAPRAGGDLRGDGDRAGPTPEAVPAASERVVGRGSIPPTRGLWVVRTTLIHPDSVRAMVRRADDAGFNTLLVQVRGRGDSYFSGGLEPRADPLLELPGFDPLALTIREGHRRGLEVHAWINVHLVANASRLPADQGHLAHQRPDLLAVPRELAAELNGTDVEPTDLLERLRRHADQNRNRVEGLYSSPSHPEVKERIYAVVMDIVDRYDVDGVHLDYLRYPSGDYDYSRDALARFRSWVGERISPDRRARLDDSATADPLVFADSLPGPWAEFRRAQITDLMERIYVGVKRRRAGVIVSAAVFPDARDSFAQRYQDWGGWLRRGIIDAVAPMAYTADDDRYEELIDHAVRTAGADRVWAGVGTHVATYRGTVDMIGIARRIGVRGVVLFSYDWLVTSGDPTGDVPFLRRVGEEGFGR